MSLQDKIWYVGKAQFSDNPKDGKAIVFEKDLKEHNANFIKKINAISNLTKGNVFKVLREEYGIYEK
jgi:hypothetical protein